MQISRLRELSWVFSPPIRAASLRVEEADVGARSCVRAGVGRSSPGRRGTGKGKARRAFAHPRPLSARAGCAPSRAGAGTGRVGFSETRAPSSPSAHPGSRRTSADRRGDVRPRLPSTRAARPDPRAPPARRPPPTPGLPALSRRGRHQPRPARSRPGPLGRNGGILRSPPTLPRPRAPRAGRRSCARNHRTRARDPRLTAHCGLGSFAADPPPSAPRRAQLYLRSRLRELLTPLTQLAASSGRSAASLEPASQTRAPPRAPPPSRPSVARRPLATSEGPQGRANPLPGLERGPRPPGGSMEPTQLPLGRRRPGPHSALRTHQRTPWRAHTLTLT